MRDSVSGLPIFVVYGEEKRTLTFGDPMILSSKFPMLSWVGRCKSLSRVREKRAAECSACLMRRRCLPGRTSLPVNLSDTTDSEGLRNQLKSRLWYTKDMVPLISDAERSQSICKTSHLF